MNVNGRHTVVYGIGYAAKILINYLDWVDNNQVDYIFVSPGHRKEQEYSYYDKNGEKRSIPIIEITEASFEKENVLIYLTVVAHNEEVYKFIVENGYENIKNVQSIENYEDLFFEVYFKKHNIDLSKEIIDFNGIQIYNPILFNSALKGAFYETVGDELFPNILNDFSLVVDGAYEFENVYLKEGDFIIDAGANIGLYSCYAANMGCTVYACEPGKKSLEILEKQKKLYDNIQIIPFGLSDHQGKMDLYESDTGVLDSFYMNRGNSQIRSVLIDTIDNLVEKNMVKKVDYIKADIEGAERYMLKGATRTLKEMEPRLSICTYHFPEDAQILEEIIKEANPKYVVKHNWRKLYAYVPK
ncbi:FkbM family methyltransferase [Lysinibacillus sp. NPDC097195]|uniref:FkbM family methyltransferase n=1 Tax=Lysinibacillus sp. NPDC097195 TaxID=3364141 RepID=UPI00381F4790